MVIYCRGGRSKNYIDGELYALFAKTNVCVGTKETPKTQRNRETDPLSGLALDPKYRRRRQLLLPNRGEEQEGFQGSFHNMLLHYNF